MAASSSTQINTSVDQSVANGDGSIKIVIFHLDTTDRNSKIGEICQIAATVLRSKKCKENEFQEYLMPSAPFNIFAASNGFQFKDEKLTKNGEPVNALSPYDGLKKFLDFLSNQTKNTSAVLLAAHNCKTFHRHVLVRILKQYGLLDTFESLVRGFIDTLDVFKQLFPEENSRALKNLAKYTSSSPPLPPYDAVVYCDIIVKLIGIKNCSDETMKEHETDLREFIRYFNLK